MGASASEAVVSLLILHLGSCRFSTGAVVRDDDRVMLIAASSPMWRDAAMAEARPRPAPWSACNRCIGWDRSWMDGWMQPGRRRGRQLWLHPRHQFHIRQGGVGGQLWPPLVNKLLSRMTKSLREKPSKGRGRLNRLTSHKASYWSNC